MQNEQKSPLKFAVVGIEIEIERGMGGLSVGWGGGLRLPGGPCGGAVRGRGCRGGGHAVVALLLQPSRGRDRGALAPLLGGVVAAVPRLQHCWGPPPLRPNPYGALPDWCVLVFLVPI